MYSSRKLTKLNYQLNNVILKNFAYCEMLCKIFFFFVTNLSQGNFLYCQRFFIPTKILINTGRTLTEMRQNLLH